MVIFVVEENTKFQLENNENKYSPFPSKFTNLLHFPYRPLEGLRTSTNHFSVAVIKLFDTDNIKAEGVFWLTSSEVSAHDWLIPRQRHHADWVVE